MSRNVVVAVECSTGDNAGINVKGNDMANETTATTATTAKLPKIPKAVADALLAAGKLDKATYETLVKEGAVTSGQGFGGGDPVQDQLVELGAPKADVDAFYTMRDKLHEMMKAKGYGVVIYLKHPKTANGEATPAEGTATPATAPTAPTKGKGKKK